MPEFDPADSRLQPGAYIHNGVKLYEVVSADGERVNLRDCQTEHLLNLLCSYVCNHRLADDSYEWSLAKPAPSATTVDDDVDRYMNDRVDELMRS